MGLFARLKGYLHSQVVSYEATVLMLALIALGTVFGLAALFIWLFEHWGAIVSCLSFAGAFFVSALIVKVVSDVKEKHAKEELRAAATELPVSTALTVARTVQSAGLGSTDSLLRPAIAIVVLLTALYMSGRARNIGPEA